MNRKTAAILVLTGIVAAGIAIYLAGVRQHERDLPPVAPSARTPAPALVGRVNFSLPDLDGNVRQLSDWHGKARLVNFWATWCAPCRREIPLLKSTQVEHGDKNLQVIGVAVDYLEPVQAYAKEADFNYPILIGQEDAMAAAQASGLEFIGLPFTMVIAPGGELLAAHIGEIVQTHIDEIMRVFERLEAGQIDLAQARVALKDL